jgi:hypothetical protein
MSEHGAARIKEWMQDLMDLARSGRPMETSGGAEPGRSYAYLQFHTSDEEHSILLFAVGDESGSPCVHAYRFDGTADEVQRRVNEVTHGRIPSDDPSEGSSSQGMRRAG